MSDRLFCRWDLFCENLECTTDNLFFCEKRNIQWALAHVGLIQIVIDDASIEILL